MRTYELRRGHAKDLEGDRLRVIAADAFGVASVEDGKVTAAFGAIEKLTAWTDGKLLYVDMAMKTGVADDVATETITRNNRFLEAATGYSAKERSKSAQKAAKEGSL